jgi:aldehyde:ferredoxin oxidoreductase
MTRRFNLREGMDPDEDRLPQKLTRQALPSGHKLEEKEIKEMIADYYRLRGWDEKGRPGS